MPRGLQDNHKLEVDISKESQARSVPRKTAIAIASDRDGSGLFPSKCASASASASVSQRMPCGVVRATAIPARSSKSSMNLAATASQSGHCSFPAVKSTWLDLTKLYPIAGACAAAIDLVASCRPLARTTALAELSSDKLGHLLNLRGRE
jgi:hypothetical protein